MSAPQSLLQAAVNRLVARLGSGLADAAAELAVRAQEAPARLQQDLSLFWEEVEQEAERLERGEAPPWSADPETAAAGGGTSPAGSAAAEAGTMSDPQDQIDALRARVAALSQRLDGLDGVAG